MTVLSTTKMTARQFLQLGEDPPGIRLELVDGVIAMSPSPTPEHSYADRQLTIIIGNYIEKNDVGLLFGDVDTIFGEHDIRRPDLLYFSHERSHLIGKGAMEGPPDLCVEIISPSSQIIDREDKFRQYEAGGVRHYWIVDTAARELEGYQLRRKKYVPCARGEGDQVISLPPFDDLKIPLSKLWLKLPPRSRSR